VVNGALRTIRSEKRRGAEREWTRDLQVEGDLEISTRSYRVKGMGGSGKTKA